MEESRKALFRFPGLIEGPMGLWWLYENISGQAIDDVELVGSSRSIEGQASPYNDPEHRSRPDESPQKIHQN